MPEPIHPKDMDPAHLKISVEYVKGKLATADVAEFVWGGRWNNISRKKEGYEVSSQIGNLFEYVPDMNKGYPIIEELAKEAGEGYKLRTMNGVITMSTSIMVIDESLFEICHKFLLLAIKFYELVRK